MRWFWQWWRQGESPGAEVYRHSWRPAIGTGVACAAMLWYFPVCREWYLAGTMAVYLARSIAERRRAIIFTPTDVVLRPALGRAACFPLANVCMVETCTARLFRDLRPLLVDGLRVQFAGYGPVIFPLDFPRKGRIKARLQDAARDGVLANATPPPPPRCT